MPTASKKNLILTLCNYGQVRSVTMANRLEARGYPTLAAGMLNTPPWFLDRYISWQKPVCTLVLVCNKPNVEQRFKQDIDDHYAQMILDVLDKHTHKLVTCDTIGFDRWGVPDHPELVECCESFLERLTNDGTLVA